eukprot:gene20436-21060_t
MSNSEQLEEIEVLSSIYPSEFEMLPPLQDNKGLSAAQADEVQSIADRVAVENIGMPSIYSVAEAVKEWLTDNNIPGQDGSMYSEEVDLAELERIRKRQAGTQVTVESFNAWKAQFDEEMKQLQLAALLKSLGGTAAAAKQELLDDALHNRPTGKQLFLMNKAGSDQDNEVEALIAAGELELHAEDEDEDEDDDDEDYVDEGDEEDDDDDDEWENEDH